MKAIQAVVFAVVVAMGVVGCDGNDPTQCDDCAVDTGEVGEVQQVEATACPVGSCNPDGDPLDIKMPTSGATTLTTAQVRSRLGGEGYSQEWLGGTKRRWTYWATRCADGSSWCVSPTYDGTPYSITFLNDVLSRADVWQRLSVTATNGTTSGADCYVYQSHVYEGQTSAGYLIGGSLSVQGPPPPEPQTHIASAGTWVWPGTSVSLKATCSMVGQPTVNKVERVMTVTMNSNYTWTVRYNVSNGTPVLE